MKTRLAGLTIPLAAAVALAGCSTGHSEETAADHGARAVPVRIQPADRTLRPQVTTASGVVQAKTEVNVAFQVAGKVLTVGPDEGSAVSAGDVLAQIDPTDYRLAVAQAEAQADRAAQERERYQPLVATGSVAANDFERIESGARQSAAAAGLARKHLADTRLVAPLSGIVARRTIQPGETAAPGQTVFTIVDVDPVKVRIGVAESEVASVRVGQRAEVRMPAIAGETFAGRVTLVGISADPTTRSYAVEVSVPNPEHRLKVGMVAEASVHGAQMAPAITVPADAVVRDGDGATLVYVLDPHDSSVHARRVETGAPRADAIEIAHGLAAGEPVVVAGQLRVRDGARVQVVPQVAQQVDRPIDHQIETQVKQAVVPSASTPMSAAEPRVAREGGAP